MEKTTKKKKSKKGLRKRIGIIAVGGLSLVLTVCLSVGATLAWFAGSTWASKSLYMGGPVYVEMAGRGTQGTDGSGTAKWQGGEGSLDIKATTTRKTGTTDTNTATGVNYDDILLPGQKVEIYSQARVYSTAETNTIADQKIYNTSTGANTVNTSNGTLTYQDNTGRITTTTTSVLRARFSIEIEFDPGMGYNNFTDTDYQENYPVQSNDLTGTKTAGTDITDKSWENALNATTYKYTNTAETTDKIEGRRDAVTSGTFVNPYGSGTTEVTDTMTAIKAGTKTSIYKWKFVSKSEYSDANDALDKIEDDADAKKGIKMGAPFDGSVVNAGGTGYYGVWLVEKVGTEYVQSESDAFYKARCNSYIQSYVEMYENEYGNVVTRTIGDSVKALEKDLNDAFVDLINDSSNKIHGGFVTGNTVADGIITDSAKTDGINASWLYIDPTIGNDTNTDEISTSVGGWWYLVADNGGVVSKYNDTTKKYELTSDNIITKTTDSINSTNIYTAGTNVITDDTTTGISRKDTTATTVGRLDAKLYEIKPDLLTSTKVSSNGDTAVYKVVSDAFPFVNGTFALPSDALTNVFSNAKITFKIAFQAIQAFFPFTETIDGIDYKNTLLGTEKALSIRNAIPVFNEAFDYSESLSTDTDSKL